MRTGAPFFLLLLLLAACAPQRPPIPPRQPAPPPAAAKPRPVVSPAAPKPAWVAKPVVADAVEVPDQRYRVVAGDTLRRISDKTGASSEAIARINNLASPFLIKAGQTLVIPGGRYHRVKGGEAGIAIARTYQVSWADIVRFNLLEEPYVLRTGQKLRLPSSQQVAAMTLEERARAFSINIDDLITGGEPAVETEVAAAPPPRTAPAVPVAPHQPVIAADISGRPSFAWPLKGRLLSRFGPKMSGRYNDGVNIATSAGAPIRAAADGIVAYSGDEIAGFGGLVLIKHGDGWVTAYAHAEALLVARGQPVKKGDVIAYAGETGSVDEPQLHFEIREGRKPVDPLKLLPPTA